MPIAYIPKMGRQSEDYPTKKNKQKPTKQNKHIHTNTHHTAHAHIQTNIIKQSTRVKIKPRIITNTNWKTKNN